jgi:hypothetical protein
LGTKIPQSRFARADLVLRDCHINETAQLYWHRMSSIDSIGPQHPVPVTHVLERRKRKPAKPHFGKAYPAQSYEVRIDGSPRGRFEEMDDALLSAAIARQEYPDAHIYVADRTSGYLINRIA